MHRPDTQNPKARSAATSIARRNITVLVIAQAFLGAQMPMITVLAGLAGLSLSPNPTLATVPIAVMGLGAATTSFWLSAIMQRYGRRIGFYIGILGGTLGASICGYALTAASFPIFVFGAYFTGIYVSAHGFYRFAAMETVSEKYRAKAMSIVMAGGLVSAVLGTQLSKLSADAFVIPFLGAYVTIILINACGAVLFLFLKEAKPRTYAAPTGRTRRQLLADPKVARAILCAATSTGVMAFVMTSTPFAVVGFGCGPHAATDVIMAHVLSMFAPCFITGSIIARIGAERVVAIGLTLLGCAAMVNILGNDLINFYAALILLGLGWNFGFIGATAMLAKSHTAHEKGRVQGLNDTIICGAATVASLSAGVVMNSASTPLSQSWSSVNAGILPVLVIAAIALVLPVIKAALTTSHGTTAAA